MSSSAPSRVFAIGIAAAGLAAIIGGCSDDSSSGNPYTQGTAGTTGQSGSTGTAGSGVSTAGSAGMSGSGAGGSSTGAAGSSPAAGSGTTAGSAGQGATAGAGGTGTTVDVTKVWKSDACAAPKAPPAGKQTIMTSGTKAADCAAKLPNTEVMPMSANGEPRCGDWGKPSSTWTNATVGDSPAWDPKTPLPRDYWIVLPQNYDPAKAYPLVFQGPGCGGSGETVYPYNNSANNTVIRVGISPPNRAVGHGTHPGQGCFDDKEGDDSVDWVFYENLYDKLNMGVCFDRNRVFSGGDSSGSWFANEVGCKYAGDATRPIRGIMPNTGGLPNEAKWKPTCTDKPLSGIWIHEVGDSDNAFSGNKYAIARAMVVNKCQANSYDEINTPVDPMMGGPAACKQIKGCPELYPLFVCPLPGTNHQSHPDTVNPAVSTYLQLFQKAPFLTP